MSLTDEFLLQVQKPARYIGGELNSVVKNKEEVDCRFAFCFPDLYEVGMSHLGIKILYSLFNEQKGLWCERVFMPDGDMLDLMKQKQMPLFALESQDPIRYFDFVGFTLQYEMSFTTVLYMLKLAGIPLKTDDRDEKDPIVVAGGPCACNPEPIADFVDIFFLGEGEEVDLEVINLYREMKREGTYSRMAFLKKASQMEGVYVPSLYTVVYNEDGTVQSVTPQEGTPATVKKRIIADLDAVSYPEKFLVPYVDIIHDRAVEEIFRGCIRGCRFCQAGFIYRPVREKSPAVIDRQCRNLCHSTGYEEFSLASLSTSDYSKFPELMETLLSWTEKEHVNVSLPSLRIDSFSDELAAKLNVLRRSGLTFAPEAGTQRLRDAINKNLTEEEILTTVTKAFSSGWSSVKLYFMMGLPTEQDDDVVGIASLGRKVVEAYYHNPNKPKGKGVTVSLSTACFVPKPFTPFQWEPQDTMEELQRKQQLLLSSLTTKKISLSYHDSIVSFWEAVLARGDRRIGKVLEILAQQDSFLDSWSEHFDPEQWKDAFEKAGLDPAFYANRKRSYEEVLPWDHLDYGVSKSFLIRENQLAHESKTTPNCREKCSGCGASQWKEGVCVERN